MYIGKAIGSAFGGIIITNKPVDAETAKEIQINCFLKFLLPLHLMMMHLKC